MIITSCQLRILILQPVAFKLQTTPIHIVNQFLIRYTQDSGQGNFPELSMLHLPLIRGKLS